MRVGDRTVSYSLKCIREGPSHLGDRLWLLLLEVASWIYRALVGLRALAYGRGWMRRKEVSVPVISVGNICLGGTGKTPLVEVIARTLAEGRKRVAILTRGYKGSFPGEALVVSDGGHLLAGPAEAGDEAFLLARQLPSVAVIVGRDRFLSGSLAIRQLGADLLVLDDAFQHLALQRNLDIVLIDASEPFGYGHLFPRGLLREPLEALLRADVLVIVREDKQDAVEEVKKVLPRYNPRAPIFIGERRPLFWVEMPGETRRGLEELRGKRCVAFSGIANPSSFLSRLSSLEVEVARSLPFPDHHPYSARELQQVAREARAGDAHALLTTEKDAVRIPADFFPSPLPLLYLRIEMRLAEEEDFFSLLRRVANP